MDRFVVVGENTNNGGNPLIKLSDKLRDKTVSIEEDKIDKLDEVLPKKDN